jgi:glycosyltransferase involved in cell wall biosynthesis
MDETANEDLMNTPLYLTTMPPPALAGTDAVYQDIDALIQAFGGSRLSLYPLRKPSRFVPSWMMGLRHRSAWRRAATNASLVHVFSATLKPIPALNGLEKPIVYTVTASVGARPNAGWFNRHKVTVIVNNDRDANRLAANGFTRVHQIRPGLDLSGFTFHDAPPAPPFRLLIGSAPWTRAQFKTKGIDALLETARQIPSLHLVFLWRQWWLDELQKRISAAGLENRVTIHNTRVDVNEILAGCHATTVLAEHERLVKSWPHSAIESLAAGKPVLLSRVIPMSEYVLAHQAGTAVETLTPEALGEAIRRLTTHAGTRGEALRVQTQRSFSFRESCDSIRRVYQEALE